MASFEESDCDQMRFHSTECLKTTAVDVVHKYCAIAYLSRCT